jgi:hypothetical protein
VLFKPVKIKIDAKWNGIGIGESKCRLWLRLIRKNEEFGDEELVYEQDIFGSYDPKK